MSILSLAQRMIASGFNVRPWREKRLYLSGYGPCIKVYIEPACAAGLKPCDGARIVVTSSWASQRAALHAKGVKHAVLQDLYKAGLLSAPPPDRWQDVALDDRPRPRPAIVDTSMGESELPA